MKLYVYKTVKSEVVNVEFLSKDLHSVHWGITPPPQKTPTPFFTKPPLNLQTVQDALFVNSCLYIGFS